MVRAGLRGKIEEWRAGEVEADRREVLGKMRVSIPLLFRRRNVALVWLEFAEGPTP